MITKKDIVKAYMNARKSRKNKNELYLFEQNLEQRLLQIYNEIKQRTYKHGSYKQIILHDSKKRYIYSPNFRDHIFHHIVYYKVYDTIDHLLLANTFACRKGFGNHRAIKFLQKLIVEKQEQLIFGERLFYLKIDFSKYFFSVHHEILKQKLKAIICSKELYYCLCVIIDSYTTPGVFDSLLKDYSFYAEHKNKGLPIGSILSQILANFYLHELDVLLQSKNLGFVRYMDDIVIVGTKQELQDVRKELDGIVMQQRLIINPKKISFNCVKDGINFIGFRIKNGKIYVGKRQKLAFLKFYRNSLKSISSGVSQKEKEKIQAKEELQCKDLLYEDFVVLCKKEFLGSIFCSKNEFLTC